MSGPQAKALGCSGLPPDVVQSLQATPTDMVLALGLAQPSTLLACTTAVASGVVTVDGRPLLWKNRDADDKRNQVISDASGRHAFVGVVNGGNMAGLEVWAGLNAAGFAIIDLMEWSRLPIYTTGIGMIASMGLAVFMARSIIR
jgi:hypothetical protein